MRAILCQEKARHDVLIRSEGSLSCQDSRRLCHKDTIKAVPSTTSMKTRGKLRQGETLFRKGTTNAVPRSYTVSWRHFDESPAISEKTPTRAAVYDRHDKIRRLESTWVKPRTPKCSKQIIQRGKFSTISKLEFYTFHSICEKLLTKSKMFKIRKVLPWSLLIWKIFEVKF